MTQPQEGWERRFLSTEELVRTFGGIPASERRPKARQRFRKQCLRVIKFYLEHPGYWTLGEIARGAGEISEAGVSARLRQLTTPEYGWTKDRRARRRNLYEYKLVPPGAPTQLDLLP